MKKLVLLACVPFATIVAGCGGYAEQADEEAFETSTNALHSGVGNCPPFDDNSVCLCRDSNLRGNCYIFSQGHYPDPNAFGALPNDSASSVALGAYVWFQPYQDVQFNWGSWWTFSKYWQRYFGNNDPNQAPSQYNFPSDWPDYQNDSLSSFSVMLRSDYDAWAAGTVPAGKVRICQDTNYSGRCVYLTPGNYVTNWAPGQYGTKGSFGLPNDSISSIQLASGRRVVVWDNSATWNNYRVTFSGANWSITSSQPNLGSGAMNDKASALQVY